MKLKALKCPCLSFNHGDTEDTEKNQKEKDKVKRKKAGQRNASEGVKKSIRP